MKTTSVKYKTKRSAFNLVLKKISNYEIAFNVGLRSFFFCLVQCNIRSIRADRKSGWPMSQGVSPDLYLSPNFSFIVI